MKRIVLSIFMLALFFFPFNLCAETNKDFSYPFKKGKPMGSSAGERQGQRFQIVESTIDTLISEDLQHGRDMKKTFMIDAVTGSSWMYVKGNWKEISESSGDTL